MKALRNLQESWAESVAAPLRFTAPGRAEVPSSDYDPDLVAQILSHGGVSGAERLDAYRLQYWFRLITLMQKDFPLLGHLLGWEAFNPLAAAYLQEVPPGRNPSGLGDGFPSWLAGRKADRQWIEAAEVDRNWNEVFDAPEAKRPTADDLENIASGKSEIVLQPTVRLMRLGRDWIPLRFALENAEPVPEKPRVSRRWWILSRSGSSLRGDAIEPGFAKLIEGLQAGVPWSQAIAAVVEARPMVAKSIGRWFETGQRWGIWGVRPSN